MCHDRMSNGVKLHLGEFIFSTNCIQILGAYANGNFIAIEASEKKEKDQKHCISNVIKMMKTKHYMKMNVASC